MINRVIDAEPLKSLVARAHKAAESLPPEEQQIFRDRMRLMVELYPRGDVISRDEFAAFFRDVLTRYAGPTQSA